MEGLLHKLMQQSPMITAFAIWGQVLKPRQRNQLRDRPLGWGVEPHSPNTQEETLGGGKRGYLELRSLGVRPQDAHADLCRVTLHDLGPFTSVSTPEGWLFSTASSGLKS